MISRLTDSDLPGVWIDADVASRGGQHMALFLTRTKVGGGVFSALGGVLTWHVGRFDLAAAIVLIGFSVALVSELMSWVCKPERSWYDGRAVAESAKTLAWRYSIGSDPFPVEMPRAEAEEVFRERMVEITREIADVVIFDSADQVITPKMDLLRSAEFVDRRAAYIYGRTLDQKDWYAQKARYNRKQANTWRMLLITSEVVAVVLAAGALLGRWHFDFAGLLASGIAAGAAWVAVKQFSPLASAYAVATMELGIQANRLSSVNEDRWALVAADAEEAISREHTTWLASRTGRVQS
ncbi:DUF4231 domain-containing protein [Rhodococcus cercidiphylli]|uniref:DUF4231 domain-containing protein n=1 Tax=Rhodococcus cercidiphylli TaxID=489916 RepID=A0ABU4AZW6_9NOCA|nr:DUF4231 domain-containing protein [Rhodococcus cercidiphylli]MDV6231774.1 DUF4231 domain-containing protein [Rhodococcus cercidiphylli]